MPQKAPEPVPEGMHTITTHLWFNGNCKEAMMDAFWGDRNGKVKDPFGHCWSIASHKWVLTPEEMQERMEEWLKSLS